MPDFPIVDAHVHLYDPAAITFDWMAQVPKLNRPHLPADFNRLTAGVDVDMMVFVEVDAAPGQHLREAEWVARLAEEEPRIAGMVASMPLESGADVEADLVRYAALPKARGVRRLIQSHAEEPGWCLREAFVEGLRLLPRHGLSFDLCLFHTQLNDVIALCRQCPEVAFVVDHIAKPGIKAGLLEPWRDDLRALSRLPNVMCKISGVVTEADHQTWTEAEVAPYVSHAIHCFGYDRVMFGGDWPVSELATRYSRWVQLVDAVVVNAQPSEKRRLYRDNAISFYRLEQPGQQ
jgi:L-fuconolactonase